MKGAYICTSYLTHIYQYSIFFVMRDKYAAKKMLHFVNFTRVDSAIATFVLVEME